jgi:hypothetical protein
VRWHSAEELLAEDPDAGPELRGHIFGIASTKILKPQGSHGSTAFAAVYRCQAPDYCDCSACWKIRSKAKRTS